MRYLYFLIFSILANTLLISQNVGIGTTNPNTSAQLDIVSSNKGILIPRTDTANIVLPVPGLMLYQANANEFYFYNGNQWKVMGSNQSLWDSNGAITYSNKDVAIGGNTKVGAGNLTVHASNGFGGVYANVNSTFGRPFYGYAINGLAKAYHYFDNASSAWILFKSGTALHLNSSNNLSVGTTLGLQKLHVNGAIKLGNTSSDVAGSIKWDNNDFKGYNGSEWKSLTSLDSSIWEYYPTTSFENDFVYRSGNILLGDFETFPNSSVPLGFSDVAKLTIASNNGIGGFWSYIDGFGGALQSFWSTESGLSSKRLAIGVTSTSGGDAHLSIFTNQNLQIYLENEKQKYSAPTFTFSDDYRSDDKGLQFLFDENISNSNISSRIFFKSHTNDNYGFSFRYNDTGDTDLLNLPDESFGLVAHENSNGGNIVYMVDRNTGFMGIGNSLPQKHFHINSETGVDALRVSINGSSALEVEANGDVGIGTPDPSDKLHISSSGTKDPFRVQMDGTTRFRVHDNGSVSIGSNTQGPVGGLYCDGIAEKPGGGLWSIASDRKLKENIESYEAGLHEILKVNPISFSYKKGTAFESNGKVFVGVIAQELQKVKPEMVDQSDAGHLRVDPNEFIYMLINATKEQQKLIEELQREIEILKKEK
jgi:hypothetical protein